MKRAQTKWAIITPLVVVLAYAGSTYATNWCLDIDGRPIHVGEARYDVKPDSDTCYANAYWDGQDELDQPSGYHIGGATNSIDTGLNFWATAYLYDRYDSDCANATIQMVQKRSNTVSSGCPSSYTTVSDTFYMNSCDGSNADGFWTPGRVGRGGQAWKRYWQWDLSVNTGSGCTDSDSGCAQIWDETECTLY